MQEIYEHFLLVYMYLYFGNQMYPDLLVHIFDKFVQVLVPGVGILILEVTAHCHHDVVGVEVLGLQSDCKKSENISK